MKQQFGIWSQPCSFILCDLRTLSKKPSPSFHHFSFCFLLKLLPHPADTRCKKYLARMSCDLAITAPREKRNLLPRSTRLGRKVSRVPSFLVPSLPPSLIRFFPNFPEGHKITCRAIIHSRKTQSSESVEWSCRGSGRKPFILKKAKNTRSDSD